MNQDTGCTERFVSGTNNNCAFLNDERYGVGFLACAAPCLWLKATIKKTSQIVFDTQANQIPVKLIKLKVSVKINHLSLI